MNPSPIKDTHQDPKARPVVGKKTNTWELDASGKVVNYAGQFSAKIALHRENWQQTTV